MHILAHASYLIRELLYNHPSPEGEGWYADLFCQNRTEEGYEDELREPLEFWIVSDQLASFLQGRGEILTHHFEFWVWGRETSALKADYKPPEETVEEFLASEHNKEALF